MDVFIDLRIYDGRSSMWFDSLSLPDKARPYITRVSLVKWANRNHSEIEAVVPFFGINHSKYKLILTAYDIMAYVFIDWPYWTTVLLEEKDRAKFPHILHS